jgi:hypothetical protein
MMVWMIIRRRIPVLWIFFLLFSMVISICSCQGEQIVSATAPIYGSNHQRELGLVKYFYKEESSGSVACQRILLVGVGTSMTVEGYNQIASAVVRQNPSLITMIMDHHVHNLVKTSPTRYAELSNAILEQLPTLIPNACGRKDDDASSEGVASFIIIAGHSSSGEAAMIAHYQGLLQFHPMGFMGLDPFEISNHTMGSDMRLSIPSLSWGFRVTTCFVNVQNAALSAYQKSKQTSRVIYLIDNTENEMTHCVFTDHGCGTWPVICGGGYGDDDELFYDAFAESVNKFLHAIASHSFQKGDFQLSTKLDFEIKVCVGKEECAGGVSSRQSYQGDEEA